jgi:hypothetical protein
MRTLRPSAACALVFVVGASALAGCSALAEIGSWTFDPLADAGALADATREPDGASDDGADRGSVRRRFPNLNHGADALIHVGSNALVANTTFNIDRALLRFDADAIKRVLGARRLRTARLRLTVFNIADTFADSNLEAHRMMAAWTESGVTWTCADDVTPLDTSENCRPPGPWDMLGTSAPPWSPTVAGSVPVTHATRSVELELTAEVSHWLEDSASNLGIVLLLPGDKGNAWLNFESHESDVSSPSPPMLELEVDDGGG